MDPIEKLKTDDSEITDKDRYILNLVFTNEKKVKPSYTVHVIIASLLFFILSLPKIDSLLDYTKLNVYYKLLLKTCLFIMVFFVLINYVIKY